MALPISKKVYADKLLLPAWQKRKTEIQIRDNFTCQKCGDDKTQLQVHHRHYVLGRDPWDYPDNLLVLLCSHCHAEEELYANIGAELTPVLHNYGVFNSEIKDFLNKLIEERIEKNKQNGSL